MTQILHFTSFNFTKEVEIFKRNSDQAGHRHFTNIFKSWTKHKARLHLLDCQITRKDDADLASCVFLRYIFENADLSQKYQDSFYLFLNKLH